MDQTAAQTTARLRRYLDDGESSIVVFYGSPFISRTAVLRSFVRGEKRTVYSAACVTDKEQRKRLAASLTPRGGKLSADPGYEEILTAFIGTVPDGMRMLLVIDHFEHLFYENDLFLKALAKLSQDTQNRKKLFTLLLSEDEVWVENTFVSKAGSSVACVDGFVKNRESRFKALREAFPDLSMRDAVAAYALYGGETALWSTYDPALTFKENVCGLFLAGEQAVLARLPMDRLESLVREPAVYATILANLAAGKEKLNDLYHATGIARAKLSVYMKTLMAPGYVEKVFSYGTVGTDQTKKGVYRISNAFLRFYYTCIYPEESAILELKPEKAFDLFISPAMPDVLSFAFRKICMEYVEDLDAAGRLPFAIADEGEWNGKAGTIDIVAQSEEGRR